MPADNLALVCESLRDDLGGLACRHWPLPPLGPGDVQLRMQAVSLNFPDLLMTRGLYQFKPPLPFVPGMEGVGVVEHAAPGSAWQPGQRVTVAVKHGLLAQRAVVPGDALQAVPDGVATDTAACVTVTGLTAWVALARLGRLQAGETLLVHGARGGVGLACVQLGLHLGARVIATASQPERLAYLASLGVSVLPSKGFREAVLAATAGQGADVVADPVGGDVFDESQRCVAFGGRVLLLGFASGRIPSLDMNRPLIKGYSVIGVRAGEYGRRRPQEDADNRRAVQRLTAMGVFRPHIGGRWPLHQALAGLQAMASRSVVGKILIELPDEPGAG